MFGRKKPTSFDKEAFNRELASFEEWASDWPIPRGARAMSRTDSHVYRAVRWGGDLRSKWDGSVDESSGWRTSCLCGWESEPCQSVSGADDEFRGHSGLPHPRNRISSDQIALRQAEAEGRFVSEYRRQGRDGSFVLYLSQKRARILGHIIMRDLVAPWALPVSNWLGRKLG